MTQHAHNEPSLFMSMELGNKEWKLGFGDGRQEREVTMAARNQERLRLEIAKAKVKFGLPENAPVYSCYEAGRDGFWIDRLLRSLGVVNLVVDPASIDVKRRARHVKTDRMDARKLRDMLVRHWRGGERKHWSVVHVPSAGDEAERRPHREAERLKKERTAHRCRIRSLLVMQGIVIRRLDADPATLRDWQGAALAEPLVAEVRREQERLVLVQTQLAAFRALRRQAPSRERTRAQTQAQKMATLKGLGDETGWNLAHEFFGWRRFHNRREVGAASGLTGCPYSSGDSHHEGGISKAGNKRVRVWMTELAWRWLRFQPQSELSRWYEARFAANGKRQRRVGIVALARKLLIALWKFLEWDQLPAGAVLRQASA